MARLFNGTTDHAEITRDLSGSSVITVSFWMYLPTNYNNNLHNYLSYGNPNYAAGTGFAFIPWSSSGGNGILVTIGKAGPDGLGNPNTTWQDHYPLASINVWHHVLVVYDRATPTTKLWIDGVAQTRTGVFNDAGPYGNFANDALSCCSTNGGAGQIAAGRIAELAIWDGDVSGPAVDSGSNSVAASLSSGVPAPQAVSKAPLIYVPWLGFDSPEPDYSGGKHSATLTGTTAANHPGTRTLLMPSSLASTDEPASTGATIDDVIPASINATSAMSGIVNAIHRIAPAAINATSAITGAVIGILPIISAAINATSSVVAQVLGSRRIIAAAINATSRVSIFGFFSSRVGFGPGNGGEAISIRLAPHNTSVTATLITDITNSSSNFKLAGDSGLPQTVPFVITIDSETIYVSASSGGWYWVVSRAVSNTGKADHTGGASAVWNDSYDMAIVSGVSIADSFTANINSTGSVLYPGWLICFDSSQAYLSGARYPMHVTSVLGVFDAGAGSSGTNRCDAAQPNAISTATGVSDNCPAALSNPSRISTSILAGDVALVRYTNPEAVVLDLGPRSAALMSWFGLKRVDLTDHDVTLTNPNGIVVDTTGTFDTFTGSVNGEWLNPSSIGIDPDTGLPTATAVPYTAVTLPGANRFFTHGAPGYNESGWPICALAVRQGNRRVPMWKSWDWHDFNFVYCGFGTDDTFCQILINRNGMTGSLSSITLPGPQNITGPDAVWDDATYYFGASWYVAILGTPYLVGGPAIGGATLTPGPPVTSYVPVVSFPPGPPLTPSITVPTFPPVEGGSGGNIPAPSGLHIWYRPWKIS